MLIIILYIYVTYKVLEIFSAAAEYKFSLGFSSAHPLGVQDGEKLKAATLPP